ncbi:uncharacterized protein TM35_000161400 [Trypanosoma theileri]|uniref:Starter acyltransferase (SAT) domain-containing protein n=1 Tax=Trypanosoma theileri TaxID=67003 RepID=A0A1X0NUZ3_9TRYP|nr:uncharacterized protein TM35_000161400 [Trypanosoma theileri]ORC88502.1 hypothetical protein TM35_000161400 [Trypanosoma theileri]
MNPKGEVYDHRGLYQPSGSVEGNEDVHNCERLPMHSGMLPMSFVGTSPEHASTINTDTCSRESRSTRRQSYLQLNCNFSEEDGIACQIRTQSFGVRRAADSFAFLNADLSVAGINNTLPSWLSDSIFQPLSSVNGMAHSKDNHQTPVRIYSAVPPKEGMLSQENSLPSAQNVNSKVEIRNVSGALHETAPTVEMPQFSQTKSIIAMENEETAASLKTGRGPVVCLQDVLNDDVVSVDSYSEMTPTPSGCTAVFSPTMLSHETMEQRKKQKPCQQQQQQQQRRRGVFGLFGTIGRGYFKYFAALFKRHQLLEPFLRRVLQSCEDIYPREIDIMEFLSNADVSPNDIFFMNPLIAWPLQVLYTISCFYVTAKLYGYQEIFKLFKPRGGLFASGKYIFAALAVAMSPTEEELMYHTSRMFRAAFLVGFINNENKEHFENQLHGCRQRSFMLLVVNISITSLQLLINKVNKVQLGPCSSESWSEDNSSRIIPMSRINIARIISTRSAVVCGHPTDLERLNILLINYATSTGVKVHREYLPTTTPENSSFYNQPQYLRLLQLWSDNGMEFDSSMLQLTVYSPVDGEAWNRESKCVLTDKIALAVTSLTQDLTYSLQHVREDDVLLNFSLDTPSLGQLICWSRHEITILVEPADQICVNVFPSPRRSALDGIIHATLAKCAKINIILQSMQWEGKPHQACVQDLSTSFIDLALLVDAGEVRKTSSNLHSNYLSPTCGFVNTKGELSNLVVKSGLVNETFMGTQLNHKDKVIKASQGEGSFYNLESDPFSSPPENGFNCILLPNENFPTALNAYELLPAVKYYEMQFNSFLTRGAVEFARRLAQCTGIEFPPHTLLMCPTVLALMELWDAYDFLRKQTD